MIKEKSVGALIFYIETKKPFFLLLKYPTYWGFVKGNIERDEDEEETARREAKEEANLSKLNFIKEFHENIHYFYRREGTTVSKEVIFLLAGIGKEEAGKVKISWEHEGFKFLEFDEALKMLKHKNEIAVLTKANDFLKEHLKQKRL
jgi:8-oxo-dGTP pyrophosphatase MutT (NUDIX family)